ncbi:hypothetical protein KUCAC02_012866 [Chaenocephalus aceratus]|uniref:Uncharacterized protein n=1 Tax=Chaenocephalus aceratus TaxID=36190 RepID=A0ACB9XCJ1_CHAAC|nr:hypothetical protein KUCAC02_012866 [Chaenocephalus aceratus]
MASKHESVPGPAGALEEREAPRLLFSRWPREAGGPRRSETQIGNDIPNLEAAAVAAQEPVRPNVVGQLRDPGAHVRHVFAHLGIGSEVSAARGLGERPRRAVLSQPIVVTEAPCNPLHCRQMMSELLFECYHVPYVSYGVDSLYSFYHNNTQRSVQPPHTGIVLSSGYHCSHILPVINGRFDAGLSRRAGEVAQPRVFMSGEVHRMQLPFSGKVPGGSVSVEERHERRAQQLRRLQEINARRREEKLLQDQERLDRLMGVQELLEDGLLDHFHKNLVELNMDSAEELQSYINKLQLAVEQGRHKLLHSDGAEGKTEVSELEHPMDEGDGVALMDPGLP